MRAAIAHIHALNYAIAQRAAALDHSSAHEGYVSDWPFTGNR
jgi:hypothetical protein